MDKQIWAVVMVVAITGAVLAQAPLPGSAVPVPQPTMDAATKEALTLYIERDKALNDVVQVRYDAMLKTPEGQEFQAARTRWLQGQQNANKAMTSKVPGWDIDFAAGRLKPLPPPAVPPK